ncbi:hypothetical protein A2810_00165 [candidate division Kazan bacterium RIFCSPHIGHO2_01_FULL_49_10]|uniref:Glycosyltransferase RgtA/B/C/D-like domain-containing protein n=1 Tax=candidate division Kazan bacterium RIFCSPLOWO2_01_FULL_48_13 TaxID=1798539 RepID=A0A1F4PPW5_UNCK3|nr:MAG: hypothetical protein A2810_00165 [candidate division Kazan bacterium RIFCSPHIGHO2_01_FULL_49_10]OGB85698.1 MAG: hypothetical protein A2994_03005 [candidate division Kazan bacterium RIFCSPLOWO2_01_FULL_48_13]
MVRIGQIGQRIKKWWKITDPVNWLLLVVAVGFCAYPLTDPDFGWQLRSGLDLLKTHQLPQFDPYSHTLPNWHWVNLEWLSEGTIAFIYQHLGAASLIFAFALMAVAMLIIAASWSTGVSLKAKLAVAVLAVLANVGRWGVRLQLITQLGLAIVLWLFSRYRIGAIKHLWWYIPLFWLWANLHGGFFSGLAVLGLLWVVEGIKWLNRPRHRHTVSSRITEPTLQLPQLRHLMVVGLLSGAATLINPYGWRIYEDIYRLFSTSFVLKAIAEWKPFSISESGNYFLWLYFCLLIIAMIFTYRKVEPTRWVVTIFFFIMMITANRNLALFLLISSGFFAEAINGPMKWLTYRLIRLRWLAVAITVGGFYWVTPSILRFTETADDIKTISQIGRYPLSAIEWAKAHPDQIGDRLFNMYGQGGFLLWQLPEKKIFIDGRMSYWQIDNRWVFRDSIAINGAYPGAVQMMEEKYQVDWVLVDPRIKLALELSQRPDWQLVYQDSLAVIYTKK